MNKIFYPSSSRGFANHGWLKATHSFSFANYYDEKRIRFGLLRVLNDDSIAPAMGFDIHPHQDMEIITIPLSGSLKHGDNLGNEEIIRAGEVQVMSAGSGVWHSEFNASPIDDLNLFQIWIFTDQKGHQPRYDQKEFWAGERLGKWQLLVSPDGRDGSLWIHQKAFISRIDSGIGKVEYILNHPENGIYFMMIDGEAKIDGELLARRDALGLYNFAQQIEIDFLASSELLVIEVPMR
jgi:redox-sensitive bicupin YhaK (pirin superfamily)